MQATTTAPLFVAELTPNRRMGAGGIWLLAGLAILLFAAPGLLLLAPGTLAVMILLALAASGIAAGLYLGLRQGKRRERITVWAEQIEWQVTDRTGARTLRRFDPATARLMLTRDAYERTIAVQLRDGAEACELGAFMSPEDKSSFAKALGTALRRARS
jgi:uncharacterized membrane protein